MELVATGDQAHITRTKTRARNVDGESFTTSGRIWAICPKRTSPKPQELTGAKNQRKSEWQAERPDPLGLPETRMECKRTSGIWDRPRLARATSQVKTQLYQQAHRWDPWVGNGTWGLTERRELIIGKPETESLPKVGVKGHCPGLSAGHPEQVWGRA